MNILLVRNSLRTAHNGRMEEKPTFFICLGKFCWARANATRSVPARRTTCLNCRVSITRAPRLRSHSHITASNSLQSSHEPIRITHTDTHSTHISCEWNAWLLAMILSRAVRFSNQNLAFLLTQATTTHLWCSQKESKAPHPKLRHHRAHMYICGDSPCRQSKENHQQPLWRKPTYKHIQTPFAVYICCKAWRDISQRRVVSNWSCVLTRESKQDGVYVYGCAVICVCHLFNIWLRKSVRMALGNMEMGALGGSMRAWQYIVCFISAQINNIVYN